MPTALNPSVSALVRRRIDKDYETPTADLYDEAVRIDPAIRKRSRLSFFASYVLPARKAKNRATNKPKNKATNKPKNEPKNEPKHNAKGKRRASTKQFEKVAEAREVEFALTRMPESAPVASPPVHLPARRHGTDNTIEDVLRRVLIGVAQDAMRAESRSEFLDLLARIDRHAREIGGSM
jgi:flagellar biosynthesis GTPase FlhF